MRYNPCFSTQPIQKGASLVEVLVSLLILTIGMLAMAALHTSSTRYGKLSEFRTTATQLADDLGDRMRSNPAGVRNGDYVVNKAWSSSPTLVTVPTIAACVGTDEVCAPKVATAVAASDLAQWNNQAVPVLPGAAVYTRSVGATVMDVWVAWLEPAARGGEDAAAEAAINSGYTCPSGMNAASDVRCMYFRFTL